MSLRTRLLALAPPPRAVDWGVLAAVLALLATGLLAWTGWDLPAALLVDLHGVFGLALVGLLAFKFARVAGRVTDRSRWDRATAVSVLLSGLAVGALCTGVFWTLGGSVPVAFWTTLNVHVGLGLAVLPVLLVHLLARARPPSRADASRRTALRYGALLVSGAVAWRASQALGRLSGAGTVETGSKPIGALTDTDTEGGSFPVTSWVADDPDPVDRAAWRLTVAGAVDEPLALPLAALEGGAESDSPVDRSTRRATLDCTSGWYTVQDWQGVRVGDLLDAAGEREEARYVRFVSVTGYRWSLPVEEARDALLATRAGGARLSHGHGAPARLVAPGRRGFQWVKWIDRVEVRRRGDPAQWVVTLISGV